MLLWWGVHIHCIYMCMYIYLCCIPAFGNSLRFPVYGIMREVTIHWTGPLDWTIYWTELYTGLTLNPLKYCVPWHYTGTSMC